jgi:hypothetical protein
MGNTLGVLKCPSETSFAETPFSCVMTCPDTYERRTLNGSLRCVHKVNQSATVQLISQPAVSRAAKKEGDPPPNPVFTIAELKDWDSDAFVRFSAEQKRFQTDLASANLRVSHQSQVDAAARKVLDAHGNDESANTNYATLTSDPDELKEIYNQMITKKTDRFIDDYQFLNNQSLQQQQTLDLVNSVKDNIATVKDDMEYSVGTFDKQIGDIRNQININRKTQAVATDYGKWMSTSLNIILVLALIFLIFTVGRRAFRNPSLPSNPASSPNFGDGSDRLAALLRGLTASNPPR